MRLLYASLLVLIGTSVEAQPIYSKTADLPALRVSVAELQAILDKASTLTTSANTGIALPVVEESLRMKTGSTTISVDGHNMTPAGARSPNQYDSVAYSYLASSAAPIRSISLDLTQYARTLTVSGQSPDHVEALFSAVRDDLNHVSSALGGAGIVTLLGFPAVFATALATAAAWSALKVKRTGVRRAFFVLAAFSLAFVFFMPTHEIFTGFLALRGDPSFLARYSGTITVIGLLSAMASLMPLSVPGFGKASKDSLVIDPAPTKADTSSKKAESHTASGEKAPDSKL